MNIDEIKALLGKITPGEWDWNVEESYEGGRAIYQIWEKKNFRHVIAGAKDMETAICISQFPQIVKDLIERVEELQEIGKIDDRLLKDRDRLLDTIPCKEHGRCVPGSIERINQLEAEKEAYREVAVSAFQLSIDTDELRLNKPTDAYVDGEAQRILKEKREGK